jgi:NAD(P)-dependent dehydrogenase (short-subunit alcohol dehydrogenase family)
MRGQSVLITGAASGIGRESALALARLGAGITVVDFDEKGGLETVSLINDAGGCAHFAHCDVTNSSQLAQAFNQHKNSFGKLDVCILNAGIGSNDAVFSHFANPAKQSADLQIGENWKKMLAINLGAVIEGTWLAVRHMAPYDRPGTVVVNSSASGIFPGGYPPGGRSRAYFSRLTLTPLGLLFVVGVGLTSHV